MGIAIEQDTPLKPQEKSTWSRRALFPAKAVASALGKQFTSPFEILSGFLIVVVSIAELIGRQVSWLFWVLLFFVVSAAFVERNRPRQETPEIKK